MGMPLSQLAQVMSAEEFGDHYADFLLSPWGPYRDNLHAAIVAREVANMAGRTLTEGHERRLDDYLIRPPEERRDAPDGDGNEIDNFVD